MISPRAGLALLTTVVLWATAFPAIRVGVADYGPAALTLARLLVASAALGLAAPFLRLRLPAWRDLPLIALTGLTGMAAYNLFLNWGELHVPAGTASLIVITNPIYSAIIAIAFLGERLTKRQFTGAAIAFAGAVVIAVTRDGLSVNGYALLVLVAAMAFGTYHAAIKPLLRRYTGLEVTAYATWTGTLLVLPALPALVRAVPEASAGATTAAVLLGLAPSALGFLTWSYAVARLPVTVATASLYLIPPIAVLAGYLWLNETPEPIHLLGGAMSIAGVVIANRVSASPRAADQARPAPPAGGHRPGG